MKSIYYFIIYKTNYFIFVGSNQWNKLNFASSDKFFETQLRDRIRNILKCKRLKIKILKGKNKFFFFNAFII